MIPIILRSIRNTWSIVADIPHPIGIAILLIFICDKRTVISCSWEAVPIGIFLADPLCIERYEGSGTYGKQAFWSRRKCGRMIISINENICGIRIRLKENACGNFSLQCEFTQGGHHLVLHGDPETGRHHRRKTCGCSAFSIPDLRIPALRSYSANDKFFEWLIRINGETMDAHR